MKFTLAAAVAGLAVIVDAKASFTNTAFQLHAGVPFNLTWTGGSPPYQVELENGPASDLKQVQSLTTTSNMYYVYTPPSSLPSDAYTFRITDASGEPNFSQQWTFQGSASTTLSLSNAAPTNSSANTPSPSISSSASPSSSSTATLSNLTVTTSSAPSGASKASNKTGSASAATPSASIVDTNAGERLASPVAPLMLALTGLVLFL